MISSQRSGRIQGFVVVGGQWSGRILQGGELAKWAGIICEDILQQGPGNKTMCLNGVTFIIWVKIIECITQDLGFNG